MVGYGPGDRKMVLVRWAELIEKHAEEIALLETLDVGKPIADTTNVDVPSAVRTIRWSGEAIDKVYEQISPTGHDSLALVTRLPLGVVAAIVPWNFPLSTTAWKLAPALAVGNSVILKPASNTPLSGLRIAELAFEAGLPRGALHVLPGPGGSLGQHLALHMDIDGLTLPDRRPSVSSLWHFPGNRISNAPSWNSGARVPILSFRMQISRRRRRGRVGGLLQLWSNLHGGNAAYRAESIHDAFIERVAAHVSDWAPGDPMDPATAMGPMIDRGQCDSVAEYVAVGEAEGATLLCGGSQTLTDSGGRFF